LERAIKRSGVLIEQVRVIEAKPRVIEPRQTDLAKPMTTSVFSNPGRLAQAIMDAGRD
jgi:hypothetical protein